MSEILKEDFLEFKEIISKKGKLDQISGGKNIWLYSPLKEYGYKIFFTHWMGTRSFFWKNNIKTSSHIKEIGKKDTSSGITTIIDKNQETPLNLYTFFNMLNKLYEHGLHPKPIEIFTYKSVLGIKIPKADKLTKDRYNNRKKEINYNFLFKIFGNEQAKKLIEAKINNHGLIDDKITLIDYDILNLKQFIKLNKIK